jgi:hypothetical protein
MSIHHPKNVEKLKSAIKKTTCRSPCSNWPLATNHRPLLIPHPPNSKTTSSEKTPPQKTP